MNDIELIEYFQKEGVLMHDAQDPTLNVLLNAIYRRFKIMENKLNVMQNQLDKYEKFRLALKEFVR